MVQAIEHAVDHWGVDIIVMSFGFGEEKSAIHEAIRYAASKEVLMFSAASNDGKNRPDGVAWPARDDKVICVHSADGHGTPSTFTPAPQDNKRIMVLGECIKSAWPGHLQSENGHKRMSGTSCAAPIAAGIAALVLDFARGFLTPVEWEKLRRVAAMRSVFESMADKSVSGYWWIKYWNWFDPDVTEGWIRGEIKKIISRL
jgi:subtilisin family serine protease